MGGGLGSATPRGGLGWRTPAPVEFDVATLGSEGLRG
jgi:hypothetical protein